MEDFFLASPNDRFDSQSKEFKLIKHNIFLAIYIKNPFHYSQFSLKMQNFIFL